jgi:hypothetical protein
MGILFDYINSLVEVEAPQTDVDIQDIVNDLRTWEAGSIGITFESLANATGKQGLGGGVLVGITLELLGWLVKFEDRGGPTYTVCRIRGGNLTAVDDAGDEVFPIEPASFVTATYAASTSASIIQDEDLTVSGIVTGVWSDDNRTLTSGAFLSTDRQALLSIEADLTVVQTDLASMQNSLNDILGIAGENVVWSGMTHDSNNNLTAATITHYTDKTLAVVDQQWTVTATYNVDSEILSYQLVEV